MCAPLPFWPQNDDADDEKKGGGGNHKEQEHRHIERPLATPGWHACRITLPIDVLLEGLPRKNVADPDAELSNTQWKVRARKHANTLPPATRARTAHDSQQRATVNDRTLSLVCTVLQQLKLRSFCFVHVFGILHEPSIGDFIGRAEVKEIGKQIDAHAPKQYHASKNVANATWGNGDSLSSIVTRGRNLNGFPTIQLAPRHRKFFPNQLPPAAASTHFACLDTDLTPVGGRGIMVDPEWLDRLVTAVTVTPPLLRTHSMAAATAPPASESRGEPVTSFGAIASVGTFVDTATPAVLTAGSGSVAGGVIDASSARTKAAALARLAERRRVQANWAGALSAGGSLRQPLASLSQTPVNPDSSDEEGEGARMPPSKRAKSTNDPGSVTNPPPPKPPQAPKQAREDKKAAKEALELKRTELMAKLEIYVGDPQIPNPPLPSLVMASAKGHVVLIPTAKWPRLSKGDNHLGWPAYVKKVDGSKLIVDTADAKGLKIPESAGLTYTVLL